MTRVVRRVPPDEPLDELPPLEDDGTQGPDDEREEETFDDVQALLGDDERVDDGDLTALVEDLADESWLDTSEGTEDDPGESLPSELPESGSWLDDEPSPDEIHHELEDAPSLGVDDEDDGPEHDPIHDSMEPVPSTHDAESDDTDDEDSAEFPREFTPPAFALQRVAPARFVTLATDGAVLAAAASDTRMLLCGEGIWELSTAALDPLDGGSRTARAILTGAGDVFSSVVRLREREWLAARMNDEILRSDDDGARWSVAGVLGGDGAARSSVQLVVDPDREGRLWARSHGGSVFRSDDAGATWDGPYTAHAVRALCAGSAGGGILALFSSQSGGLMCSVDGATWEPVPFALPEAPSCMARMGEVIVVGSPVGAVRVSVDGGRTSLPWPELYGAHLVLLLPTDDGAVRLVAAIGDASTSHTTLVEAVIGRDGAARGMSRFADVDEIVPPSPDEDDGADERDTTVEALVPIDPCGRRIIVVTAVGVAVVARGD